MSKQANELATEPSLTVREKTPRIGPASFTARWTPCIIYAVFFLSGAAALIYEISWSRQIGLLFGHTVQAASVVLASYFAGMAIGYFLGAKWSARISPLYGYAIAEIVVAVWAFMIPLLLDASQASAIAPWLSSSSIGWQITARAVFSFLLLLPATIALGVTLPMIADYFSTQPEKATREAASIRITWAYALNTAGAFIGVLLATFYMLVIVGVRNSSYVAAGLSVICATVAFLISRFVSLEKRNIAIESNDAGYTVPDALENGILALSFLSGFGILALQVLYTRMFSLVFHNSTYTFGIVVAVFLASLALGAAIAAQLQRWIATKRIVGVTTGLGALATAVSIPVFVWLTELKYFSFGDSFFQYMAGAILLVAVVVAPAITCLGMLLPLVWKMAGRRDTNGQVVGKLTAVNTIAAAIGALSASFFFLVWVGLWPSIVVISTLLMVAAVILLWQANQKQIGCVLGFLFAISAVLALRSPIESAYNRTEYGEKLVKRWNSSYGWIDVVQREESGAFKVRQNLHYRFGTTGNDPREYRQAHIPLLLHDNPQDVLFLGLGTGLTAGGAVPHKNVDCIVAVELIPEVVEAARILADHNFNVVDHPKVEIRVDDARHYLYANPRQFDVIISDLFVPWESQSGYLYTVENYQIALQRLKPGGLFCQWLPLYQLGPVEFESIANSFASVFANTTIWWGQLESASPVIALVGTHSPLEVGAKKLDRRIADLGIQMGTVDTSIANSDRFWDHYIGDWEMTSSTNLNTDEHPRVEFLTPISNRNGKMIRGKQLERYYESTFARLPANSAKFSGEAIQESTEHRRARQRLILFGH